MLRDERVTSALIGASSVRQLEANVAAVGAPKLTAEELAEIDKHAVEPEGVNLWSVSSEA
ncbi:aryl-alcohol dehydrogenase-like predicted oxidoreductase [Streptomyces sp. SPB162]|nr:aryl-alcohol dehydrogenase-like predicted oxidoreductase [Streptomyces sp. SPB162]